MKEFFNKNKKVLLIILVGVLLVSFGAVVYFFILDKGAATEDKIDKITTVDEEQLQEGEDKTPGVPDYDVVSSSEAVDATYVSAQAWSDDVKLYNCTGLPTSVQFSDITYDFVGADSGKYFQWICTYYSKGEMATKIFLYKDGVVDESTPAVEIGEYGELVYNEISYPTDLTSIVDSVEIYAGALEQGLSEENYVNMYLADVADYGFVWKVVERSKTDKDENDIGALQNVYIFDIYTGELEDITQKEVY